MECKQCGNTKFYTIRTSRVESTIQRHRVCIECKTAYITTESITYLVKFSKKEGKEVRVSASASVALSEVHDA